MKKIDKNNSMPANQWRSFDYLLKESSYEKWVNPLLIKDIAIAIRGKGFLFLLLLTFIFFSYVIANVMLQRISGLIYLDSENILYFLLSALGFLGILVIPITQALQIIREFNSRTFELIEMSGMTPFQIAKGFLLAGIIKFLLIFSLFIPFLLVTLELGNIEPMHLLYAFTKVLELSLINMFIVTVLSLSLIRSQVPYLIALISVFIIPLFFGFSQLGFLGVAFFDNSLMSMTALKNYIFIFIKVFAFGTMTLTLLTEMLEPQHVRAYGKTKLALVVNLLLNFLPILFIDFKLESLMFSHVFYILWMTSILAVGLVGSTLKPLNIQKSLRVSRLPLLNNGIFHHWIFIFIINVLFFLGAELFFSIKGKSGNEMVLFFVPFSYYIFLTGVAAFVQTLTQKRSGFSYFIALNISAFFTSTIMVFLSNKSELGFCIIAIFIGGFLGLVVNSQRNANSFKINQFKLKK